MTSPAEIAPAYDFEKLTASLKADPSADLSALLTQLAQIPAQEIIKPVIKKDDPAEIETLNQEAARALTTLPEVFNKTPLPATRRELRNSELDSYRDEKKEIAALRKLLNQREEKINEAVSRHFDVTAEKAGKAKPEETPVDANGHYLIGGSSKELRQNAPTPSGGEHFVREKTKDSGGLDHNLLLAALEEKKITPAEYRAFTREVTIRELDPSKFSLGLLSKARRKRTQEIMTMITRVKYGTLSVKLRK
ncbi:hypothetical protein OG497_37390 [Streptomyces sp. NBC_01242]|uniref:hypothetical protein n=1 Tax=Streptomyces sp. NBC_01242 TaxID=2903795 RepID=UPI002253209F|nr:hypothetical protein [Streptomyces sp. NBC_01242]MCX4799533.1 hypothetical protein [Streptomyces sp. NBC_01242]